jgi:hypothetical protein
MIKVSYKTLKHNKTWLITQKLSQTADSSFANPSIMLHTSSDMQLIPFHHDQEETP